MTCPPFSPDPDAFAARARLEAALGDPALRTEAHYLLWETCQVCGDPVAAMAHLHSAIALDPLRTRHVPGAEPRRSVLALATPGDFQANLPLGLLLDGSTLLHTLWIADPDAVLADPVAALPPGLPPIDCVFVAIGEDARQTRALQAADALARAIGRPVINPGAAIAALSRDSVARLLAGVGDAMVPAQRAATAGSLLALPPGFPAILRPRESHAGHALVRIEGKAALARHLHGEPSRRKFFVAPFVDFRGADGLFRKARIAFVGGRPFPVHLAIHDDWAVWYYNAGMDRFEDRRAEEAAFLADMPGALGPRAMVALERIGRLIGLDYAGLDCAVLPDGRLLVFEVETAMLVHDRDPPELFGYRRPAVARIASALSALLDRKIAEAGRDSRLAA